MSTVLHLVSVYLMVGWAIEIARLIRHREKLIAHLSLVKSIFDRPDCPNPSLVMKAGMLIMVIGFVYVSVKHVVLWPWHPIRC